MRVLISGASGLIGTALGAALRADGTTIGRLARPGAVVGDADVRWDPVTGEMDLRAAEGTDAVVNLAGASIGEGRWTANRKALLRSSRIETTERLVQNLGRLARPPKVLVSASAIGYYGDRGEELLTESSAAGDDFLSGLAKDWESAALGAEKFGARVVLLRFGIVLSKKGGALPRILMPFKTGVGGRIGSGKQWMSWVALDDTVGIIRQALGDGEMRGAVNAVAPNPVRNVDFTRALARVVRRPAIFPAPAFALRLALGEMADALLLSSQRVRPKKLAQGNFQYRFGELEGALRRALE